MVDLSEFHDAQKKVCVVEKFVTTLSTTEQEQFQAAQPVSYTHLTLPTKRIV